MNGFYQTAKQSVRNFIVDDDGAQVVEYALIIALVSIALAGALAAMDISFDELANRVTACLTGNEAVCKSAPAAPAA